MPYLTNVQRLAQGVVGSVQPEEKRPAAAVAAPPPPRRAEGSTGSEATKPPKPPSSRKRSAKGAAATKAADTPSVVSINYGESFPAAPKRFDRVIEHHVVNGQDLVAEWVYDLPRNEDGEWMTEGPDGEDVQMDWQLVEDEEAGTADSERSEEEES